MLEVEKATEVVREVAATVAHLHSSRSPESIATDEAVGRTTAGAILATGDSPPFDKAMMDGFAVRAGDHAAEGTRLPVAFDRPAGPGDSPPLPAGAAARIMTGAPVPEGADAVIPVERTACDDRSVTLNLPPVSPETNVLRRGSVVSEGSEVLAAGTVLAARHLAALLEFGVTRVPVRPSLSVGVLATGDELVDADVTPGPGQIRNTNEPMLSAQARAAGADAFPLGVASDDRDDLRRRIEEGLSKDILLLSGGVSAGDRDFVPSILAECGVRKVFHKVALKPGKPLWFGEHRRRDGTGGLVFGLPGNPVSSFVCFELLVRVAIDLFLGREPESRRGSAVLTADFTQKGDRTLCHPSRYFASEGADTPTDNVEPLPWKGSSDLATLAAANCLIVFPSGNRVIPAGTVVDIVLFD